MNYQKITPISIADGIGCRVVLWVSGCEHNCYNCHNPDTHDPTSGYLFDEDAETRLFLYIRLIELRSPGWQGDSKLKCRRKLSGFTQVIFMRKFVVWKCYDL